MEVSVNKISAIVVTYNRIELLKECIRALINNAENADIFIIDNASTDGTEEEIKIFVDNQRVFYFNTGKNIGGAGGFNYGIKQAYSKGYDYFWLMDDDTIVDEMTLNELVSAIETIPDGRFGYLSSIAYWTDGSLCKMNNQTPTPDHVLFNQSKSLFEKGLVPIQKATFVSFFVNRKVVQDLGFPIKEYFIWGDDTEYSTRIAARYPCYLVGKSKVLHKMRENKDSTDEILTVTDINRIERVKMSVRNDCCTYRRVGLKRFTWFTIYIIKTIWRIMRNKCTFKGKKVRVFIHGYIQGLFFHPSIEKPD